MDKGGSNWWMFPRWTKEYENGVDKYIERAYANEAQGNEICCPCKVCHRRYWFQGNVVKDHMIAKGCNRLPEVEEQTVEETRTVNNDCGFVFDDNMDNLLHDTFRNGPNEDAEKFYKLVKEGEEELYPGCKGFSKLSFLIRLFVYKRDHNLSNGAFTDLLKILKAMQPDARLPNSFNEAKKMLKLLGLDYVRIDACPNDCMLYWDRDVNAQSCRTCKTSRWKKDETDEETGKVHRIPAKILRYFPIKPRLQRLFMCPTTARKMTWHETGRPKDGLLRHPADGKDWQKFDSIYPLFAGDPRNVRFGLSSDGFNPFNSMSIVHSTWPVILSIYNLPPWMSMKPEFLILTLLIPGPLSPGNDIDVYLQPLIKDLKELWECGIETYDASKNSVFNLRAALLFTISDFPGLAMLSGWSTKGSLACPVCHYENRSLYLKNIRKTCYTSHRRFLREDHPYRRNRRKFGGNIDMESAPIRLSGTDILELLAGFKNEFGKNKPKKKISKGRKTKKKDEICPWKKMSIFFDLPYWMHIDCRHCLDVMHIEKNFCDNVIGTLLDIVGKTKDHMRARMDLAELNLMPELQLKSINDGEHIEIAKARFWMTLAERSRFCAVIKNAKLPQACDSNIARCVNIQQRKIMGYKSHDAHFLMQYLLPICVSQTLHKDIAAPLIRLSAFFKAICGKVIDPEELDYLQNEISEVLCQFEMIFPPTFFDIMVHLPVHLVEEIRLGGPVACRWMYPIERYLRKLKSFVRNKGRPEGSMAEAYLAEECATFCARYLHRGTPIGDMPTDQPTNTNNFFPKMGHPIMGRGMQRKKDHYKIDLIKWSQAHLYVLFNCHNEEVERYIREHETLVSNRNKRRWDTFQRHSNAFIDWFKERVEFELGQGDVVPNFVKLLAAGPSLIAKRYSGYSINGYKFHTMKRDKNSVTDNSGVTLSALTPSFASRKDKHPIVGDVTYYGSIEEIVEIFYGDQINIVLFGCLWFHCEEDTNGLARINRKKLISQHEPFILASQARQVFYVQLHTLLREEMKQNDPEKRCPTQADLYIESRKRKVDRTYSTPYDETQQNIEKMKELQSLNGGDPYYEVIGEKEHSGRLRMYGHGVTQSSLKKKDPMKPYIVPSMLLDSIAAEVDKKVKEQLAEEVDKRVKEKLDAEVDKRLEEKFASFLSKFQAANPGVNLHISDSANDEGDASSSFQN